MGIFQYTFVQNAFLAAILSSIACGVVGAIIIEKKLVMLSGGIAHTAFGGIGMAYYFGFTPVIGAMIFSILAAISIPNIERKSNTYSDVLIGMIWAVGMAVGVAFIAFVPGYPPDMMSYLFGDILTVSLTDILMMFFNDMLIVLTIGLFFNALRAYIFDQEFVSILKLNIKVLEYILYILIAATIVVLIRVVGIVLVIALLTIPPSIAKIFTFNFKKIIFLACIIGMILCFAGLCISYEFNIASGATIILLAAIVYLATLLINRWKLSGKAIRGA